MYANISGNKKIDLQVNTGAGDLKIIAYFASDKQEQSLPHEWHAAKKIIIPLTSKRKIHSNKSKWFQGATRVF